MFAQQNTKPSLENLFEGEDLGFEILHPGGLEIMQQLAALCRIGRDPHVVDIAPGMGETAFYLSERLGARVLGIDDSSP